VSARNVGEQLDRLAARLSGNPAALSFVKALPRRQTGEEIRANSAALLALLEVVR
jgi:hypothetical protein